MRRLLLVASLALASCATAPEPETRPVPVTASLSELQSTYLPRIVDNSRSVDSREARRDEIVAQMRSDAERQRDMHQTLLAEIEAKEKTIELLEDQRSDRERRLEKLRAEAQAGEAGAERIRELEHESSELDAEIKRESAELEKRREKAEEIAAHLERLANLDEDELFLDAMQPVYREGIELHLGFYRGVIELTRQQLTGSEAGTLIERFEERIAKRDRLAGRAVEAEAFASLRHELELDRRLSQAWLSAFILEVRFSLSEFRLETISAEEQGELALLAEALAESWSDDASLVMRIDGHSDSKKFRGRSDCDSATLNKDLSRRRAEAVRDYFTERLGGEAERIEIDWYGNFSIHLAAEAGEVGDRRIELRIATRRADGSHGSHRDYFTMLSDLELAGRRYVRRQGAWIDAGCVDTEPEAEVVYLSDAYRELAAGLGLDASARVRLGADGRELDVRLGNEAVVDGERCVRVVPCEAEEDSAP